MAKKLTDEELNAIMNKTTEGAGEEIKKGVETFIDQVFKKGQTPKDALGLSDAQIEGLYAQAYRLFNNGKYKDAKAIFRIMIALNALDPRYTMGLAACCHMMQEYELAVPMYLMSFEQDKKNPLPLYHASDCFLKKGDVESAIFVLTQAVDACGDREDLAVIKDRSQMMLQSLYLQAAEAPAEEKKEGTEESSTTE